MQAVSRAKRPCGMEQAGSLHREALRQPSGRWELRKATGKGDVFRWRSPLLLRPDISEIASVKDVPSGS